MPIKIFSKKPENEIAWLCDDCWRLPDQIAALEAWLDAQKISMESGSYIADIGFSPRENAAGGGVSISTEMMRTMADLGISLVLSEYPFMGES